MSSSPSDREDRLPKLIGEAIVAWSQVEATWAHIFFHLVYDGIGQPLEIDQETGVPDDPHSAAKRSRAAAVFFSVPSSKTQRSMVVELAKVALEGRPDLVDALKRLADKTDKIGKWRNRIVHAYYDRPMSVQGTAIAFGPISVSDLMKYQFSEDEVAKQITEFKRFNRLMDDIFLAVVGVGDLPQLGEPAQRANKKLRSRRRRKEKR